MKKNEKIVIFVLLVIVVILIIVSANRKNSSEQANGDSATGTSSADTKDSNEEYVEVLEDGTRLNVSTALHETKTIDDIEITDIQLTSDGSKSTLLATTTNTSRNGNKRWICSIHNNFR